MKMMNTVEIDRILESRATASPAPPFWQRFKTNWYVGSYNYHSKDSPDGGCMSSRMEQIRFTPMEEERFCRAALRLAKDAEQWVFDGYHATHIPSRMRLWVVSGRDFLRVEAPHSIALRTGTQKRLFRAIHAVRHSRPSPEARAFISQLEATP